MRTARPVPDLEPDRPVRTVSLRTRVVLSVLALLAVLLVLLGLVVTTLLGNALRADLQQRLQERAGYAVVLQERGVTGQTLADQLSGTGVFSSFTADGREFVGRGDGPTGGDSSEVGAPGGRANRGGPPGPGQPPTLPQPGVEPTVTVADGDGFLTATVELPDGTLTLRAGEYEIDRTLSVLRTIEIVAAVVALAVAAVLLVRVVGVALRPLETMTALAHRIGGGARGRRLRPTRPDTELGRTAQAFDQMLDALEAAELAAQQAEERMRRFLADASHDLRTPLAGVIAGSDSLLRADPDELSRQEREDRLVLVVRQARRAARLVDDLLMMTRLDAGTPTAATRRVQVFDLVEQEAQGVSLRRPEVEVRVHDAAGPAGPAQVRAVPDELRRAVANVLDNAVTVSPPGGTVRVEVTRRGDGVVVEVVDGGPGVPEADRERIFDRFVRLAASRHGGGSGLGLPIARAIVRAHGGDLRCTDRADGRPGGCFRFTLPAAEAQRTIGAAIGPPEPPAVPSPRPELAAVPGPAG